MMKKLLLILSIITLSIYSTIAKGQEVIAKQFTATYLKFGFCNTTTEKDGYVYFGDFYPLYEDLSDNKNKKGYGNRIDNTGHIVKIGKGLKYETLNSMLRHARHQTLRTIKPLKIVSNYNDSSQEREFSTCTLYEDKDGRKAIVNNGTKGDLKLLMYNQASYALILEEMDVKNLRIEYKSGVTSIFQKSEYSDFERLVAELYFDDYGKYRAVYFAVNNDIEETVAALKIMKSGHFTREDSSQLSPPYNRKFNLFKMKSVSKGEYTETKEILEDKYIVPLKYTHNYNKEVSVFANSFTFTYNAIRVINYISSHNNSSLKVMAAEEAVIKVMGPNFAELVLCELTFGKNSTKCDEYR